MVEAIGWGFSHSGHTTDTVSDSILLCQMTSVGFSNVAEAIGWGFSHSGRNTDTVSDSILLCQMTSVGAL